MVSGHADIEPEPISRHTWAKYGSDIQWHGINQCSAASTAFIGSKRPGHMMRVGSMNALENAYNNLIKPCC